MIARGYRSAKVLPLAIVLASVMAAGSRSSTAETAAADAYRGYHRMVYAASTCAYPAIDVRYDNASGPEKSVADHAQQIIARHIEAKVGSGLSAGERLFLIEQARGEVREIIHVHGCGDERISSLVSEFEHEFPAAIP